MMYREVQAEDEQQDFSELQTDLILKNQLIGKLVFIGQEWKLAVLESIACRFGSEFTGLPWATTNHMLGFTK